MSKNALLLIKEFLCRKLDQGSLSHSDFDAMLFEMDKVVNRHGDFLSPNDLAFGPVCRQAAFEMKNKIIEMHPEFEQELGWIGGGRRSR